MISIGRAVAVSAIAAIGFIAPALVGGAAVSAQSTERVAAREPALSKVVVPRPVPRPKPVPVPLLGVGIPAFAAAGMALAGYKLWRRRRSGI